MLFDGILVVIGQFGIYQICVFTVLGLTGLLNGWNNLAIAFTGANMDHWCKVDALSNFSFKDQKYIMAPLDERKRQEYSQCLIYDINYSAYSTDDFLNWNRSDMVNSSTPTIACSSWVYDQSVFVATIRNKWDLVCNDDYLVQMVQTCYMAGFLVGNLLLGQLSDIYGRRKILITAISLQAVFNLAGSFAPVFWFYCICRFFVGVGIAGGFTVYTVLIMELIGPKYRVVTGIMCHEFITVGDLTLTWFSYAIRDHAKLELLVAILTTVLLVAVIMFSPESPRWLVGVKRDDEATKVLQKMANINGTILPEELNLEDNRASATETEKQPNILDLLKPTIRWTTLCMWFSWFSTCIIVFGLSLGVRFLKGSLFVNNTLLSLIATPVDIIIAIALIKFGRRWPLIISYLSAGVFCMACIPVVGNDNLSWLFTTLMVIGKGCCVGTFPLLYFYSAELFPTRLRNIGVGSSSTVARIGGILQPQLALSEKFWAPFPFFIYGVLSIIAAIIAFFLPETKGKPLPENLEDMKNPRKVVSNADNKNTSLATIGNFVDNPGFMDSTKGVLAKDIDNTLNPGSEVRQRQMVYL